MLRRSLGEIWRRNGKAEPTALCCGRAASLANATHHALNGYALTANISSLAILINTVSLQECA